MLSEQYSNVIDMSSYYWHRCLKWARLHHWPLFIFTDAEGLVVEIDTPETWAIWLGTASMVNLKILLKAQKQADSDSQEVS